MKHNLKRVLRLTEDRAPWVRAVRAWRALLPDWTPSLDAVKELDLRPHEHGTAVRIVADGWGANDPRWDVLMALLEWERRDATAQVEARESVVRYFEEFKGRTADAVVVDEPGDPLGRHLELRDDSSPVVIPIKVVQNGRVVSDSETTVETPLKAFFLDNVVPIKHLSEKRGGDV